MDNSLALAAVIGPVYLVLGLSILLYVKQYKKVIAEFAQNHFVMLFGALMSLVLGLIVIHMHNLWEWNLFVILTITGWGMFIKGLFYFLAPSAMIKHVLKSKMYKVEGMLYFWGALMAVLGLLLSYNAYMM